MLEDFFSVGQTVVVGIGIRRVCPEQGLLGVGEPVIVLIARTGVRVRVARVKRVALPRRNRRG